MFAGLGGVGCLGTCYYAGRRPGSVAGGDGEVEEPGRFGQLERGEDGLLPGGERERCATWPSAVARVTRCMRSSSWRTLRQVSPVAFSTTRMSSSASQHSWMWARMRSSRWWKTGRSPRRSSCRASRLRRRAVACRPAARSSAVSVWSEVRSSHLPSRWASRLDGALVDAQQPGCRCGAGSGAARAWSSGCRRTRRGGRAVQASEPCDQLGQVRDQAVAHGGVALRRLRGCGRSRTVRARVAVAVAAGATRTSLTRRLPATVW